MRIKLWCIWQAITITRNPRMVMAAISGLIHPALKIWNYRFYFSGQSVPGWLFEVSERGVLIPENYYVAKFLQPTVILRGLICTKVFPLTGDGGYVDVVKIEFSGHTKDWDSGLVVTFRKPTRLITRPIFQWWQLFIIAMVSILSLSLMRTW